MLEDKKRIWKIDLARFIENEFVWKRQQNIQMSFGGFCIGFWKGLRWWGFMKLFFHESFGNRKSENLGNVSKLRSDTGNIWLFCLRFHMRRKREAVVLFGTVIRGWNWGEENELFPAIDRAKADSFWFSQFWWLL